MSPILTAHVADDLVPQLILPVPAQLQVALQPLDVRLELDHQSQVVLARVLVILLVAVAAPLPAGVASSSHGLGVGPIDLGVRHAGLVKVVRGLTVGESCGDAVTSIPEVKGTIR